MRVQMDERKREEKGREEEVRERFGNLQRAAAEPASQAEATKGSCRRGIPASSQGNPKVYK